MTARGSRRLERALAWLRALRRKSSGWSATDDRHFHDSLFAAPAHDPFSVTYPGNITIRRFADRADPFVRGSRAVVDLGCGPGEITCELARRHPGVEFRGIDHSAVAIEQAAANAARAGVNNVRFDVGDLARLTLPGPVDLVTMFDAFHHLLDPAGLVSALSPHVEQFLLIEPAGDLLGRWRRTADFDWVPSELDKIRLRIEHELGVPRPATPAAVNNPEHGGRAVENRYPITDYEAFFTGYEVECSGTVAGLDAYPTAPDSGSEFRAELMDAAYRLLGMIDRSLHDRGSDLYAKHWVIHAVRRARQPSSERIERRQQPPVRSAAADIRVQGPWDARYLEAQVPAEMAADAEVLIEITVGNDSWRAWDSFAAQPVKLSYHWIDRRGSSVVFDGLRTGLPRAVEPGSSVRAAMVVRTPQAPGRYILQIDLVEEHVTWFSRAGTPPFSRPVRVTTRRRP